MASRLALPKIQRIEVHPEAWLERGRRGLSWRPPKGEAGQELLWRTITAPLWLGSDVPAPSLPAREGAIPPAGPAGDQVAALISQIGRRVWLQRALTILMRSVWLTGLVGCLWLLVELEGGRALSVRPLIILAIVLVVLGIIFASLVRPSSRQVARMLDRSFRLQERMSTAVDNLGQGVPQEGERATLVYLQMADAANVVADLRRHSTFKIRPPIREIVLGIACALFVAALYFLRGMGGDIPAVQAGAVPEFTPATERIAQKSNTSAPTGAQADAPTTEQVQQRAAESNQARQDLDKLAKALDDHAVTSSAATSMKQGDYNAAADELRNLSNDANKLSPGSREDLAQDLDTAASQMSASGQPLADASRKAADGLRQGDKPAQEGVRSLGDQVEKSGKQVASQQELAEQMKQAVEAAKNDPGHQSSSSENNGDSADGSQNEGASGQQGNQASGNQGANGQGSDAQPGDASQGSNSSQDGQQANGQAQAGGQQPADGGATNDPSSSENGQPGSSGASGTGKNGEGNPSNQAQQGDGAKTGAGAGGASAQNGSDKSGTGAAATDGQQPSDAQPPAANVTKGNGEGGTGQGQAAKDDPREAITLSRSPDGDRIQTSSNNGGSNVGAGPGVSVSSGTSTQGAVGVAGPDSNRVPPDYRSIVEDYFSDPTGS